MKKIVIPIAVLIVSVVSAQSNIDVLHYKFNIGLNDVNDTIHGVAEIKLRFRQPSGVIYFDFADLNKTGRGMKIKSIGGIDFSSFIQEKNTMRILLPKMYKTNDTATVIISYSGIPADGLIISKTKYGRRGFFADNWPNRAHYWIPCQDDPADKASVEFIITAPALYNVVANGIQIKESLLGNGYKITHWKEDTPVSTKVMVIGVAEFAIDTAGYVVNDSLSAGGSGIPVYSYVYPENREKGFYDYSLAKDILPFFINYIGPYGYKKLANVQSKTIFGGLENANTIFYSENSVTGTRKIESLLAHEIAHQWFGNMATEKSFGHLWLSEGFATYFTILYFEKKYGNDTAIYMLKKDREQVIAFSIQSDKTIVDTAETDFMNLLNVNSYQKGGWVLHMLRSELGDSVFYKAIRKYYAIYAGGIAGTEDLQKVFEDVSGKNLKQFFRQWLYSPGLPNLDIVWNYDSHKKNINFSVTQVQPGHFSFPLELFIRSSDGTEKKVTVSVDEMIKTFIFPVNEKPIAVLADKDVKLLAGINLHRK
jgi:aminopeptidase N